MASKEGPLFSRTEVQQEIRKQGDIIRQLKLEEQTDEVKNKVAFLLFFSYYPPENISVLPQKTG